MPAIKLDYVPAEIPGLTFQGSEARGAFDALEAAGVKGLPKHRAIGFDVPAGVELRPFQKVGVAEILGMLKTNGGAILGDEMGLGKTPQGAIAAHVLTGDDPNKRVLVVCPAGVRHQWVKWAQTVAGPHAVISDLGPPSKKSFAEEWAHWLEGKSKWAVTSYQLMKNALEAKPKPHVLIFDEPHNFLQGRGNAYVKPLWKHGALIPYKLALTGSPYLARPAGLWQLLNVLLGMRFGRAHDFDVRYCNGKEGTWGWENSGATNSVELAKRLQWYMVRRFKADVVKDMPKVSRSVRWVEGTRAAQASMLRMDRSVGGLRSAQEPALQDKVKEVVNVCDEAQAPCVVFCWRRIDAEQVQAALEKDGQAAICVHGENDPRQRAALIAQAQSKKAHVVTTYGASSTGIDGLQHFSSNAVFHAIDPVVATLLQAVGRLDRMGQTLPVTATFIAMKDSVDELLVERAVNRIDDYQRILGRDKSSTSLRDALLAGGHGDIDNDAVLQSIFDSMT